MSGVEIFNKILGLIFVVCYSYQFFYILVSLTARPIDRIKKLSGRHISAILNRNWQIIESEQTTVSQMNMAGQISEMTLKTKKDQANNYAVLICARNEQQVIGDLLDSLKKQNYPAENFKVFVLADNCDDKTAETARKAGAYVWERFNKSAVGKGYALQFLLEKIDLACGLDTFAGFFVFDADNLLEVDFISQMDMTFCSGYEIVTSYRNSKNYADNWISSGYSLWFLREARYLNAARMRLGASCAVSGTGFLFSRDVLKKCGGWNFHLLTEDIEFSVCNIIAGRKIGYCEHAVLYDEQPVSFAQSWQQRLRWAKGYLQVFRHYGLDLLGGIRKLDFSCFDMTMAIMPAILLSVIAFAVNFLNSIILLAAGTDWQHVILPMVLACVRGWLGLFMIGALTLITEWKQIHASTSRKLLYAFTFPLFMLTYIPISLSALIIKVEWKQIRHTRSVSLAQVRRS
jgi:cellulose synthase/poly-beta-1,6-N-acetylglucosamine synthase-like glycosyltransferase